VGPYAPYLPFVLALTVVSFFGGRGPGLVAGALSVLALDWFFVGPHHFLAIETPGLAWGFGLFVVTAASIALLVGSLRESLLARARMEQALRQQSQLIDLSHDAVITMDSQRRILKWNKGAEEFYGWSEQDAVGKVLPSLLQIDRPSRLTEVDEVLHREGRWEGEITHTTRGGRRVIVDSRQVLLPREGELPERILAINRDITEQKHADEALRASQARLEIVLDAAKAGVWDLDLVTHVTWRSRQHDEIFGYPEPVRYWTYETFLDHVLPEDRENIDRMVQQAVANAAAIQLECRIRRADGALRWIWVAGRSYADDQGRPPQRMCGIVRDITERKRTEEALRQSEDQFRTLADAIPQFCGMADPDGSFFWTNRRWCDYTGLTPEQSEGWGWLAAVDREASAAAVQGWQNAIATGEPFESVFAARGVDGVVRPFLALAMPLRDRDGNVFRWFCTMTDISEQRKTEDALRQAHSEELARRAELQAIMDAAPVAMFLARDPDCRQVLGNRSAYELFREPPGSNLSPEGGEAAACRMMRDGKEVPPDELPMQRAAATGHGVYDQELDLAYADGSGATIIGNAVPLLDSEGRSRGAVGIFLDITERKQTEERLRQAQKLESIGMLAGGIAHDFNNLLTVILGNADLARMQYPSCEPIRHIINSSERAADLTRQLLAYSGKGQFISKTFDLTNLVSRCRELLSSSIPKTAQLRFSLSHDELLIKADPVQIEQILVNLVINASEAMAPQTDGRIEVATSSCEVPPEAARVHVPVYDARPGPFVCLEVSDNGSGMSEETLARIFNPFFSTKFTGRGLGLAAVQGIVRSCHGFIDVQSSPGAGSRFRVFLPSAGRKTVAISAGSRSAASQRQGQAPAVILVVDDEEMVRELACAALKDSGYEVLEARRGREVLNVLAGAASTPSLVLLDLTVRAAEKAELVPVLNQKYPELRIILTSDYPEEDALRGFPPRTVAGFLQKPYSVATLTEKVKETLRGGGGPGEEVKAAA
jgi:two-component system, cell cycle sensor histidine kinase and response regulator CckA